MSKIAVVAAFAAVALTSISLPLPASAQPTGCIRGQCPEKHNSSDSCGSQLGHLTRVFPAEVLGIESEQRVWVTEFCLGDSLMRSDGNAAYLRTAIADNDVLVDVLQQKGYFAEDVFAVKMMGDDTINLYVHRFRD